MPRYVIERKVTGVGHLCADEVKALSQKSCRVLRDLGTEIQWVQSFVSDDAFTCVYLAGDETAVREHAERGGFPADSVREIHHLVDPTSAGD